MKRPSRGERLSATTTRQTGSFFPPTRVSLMLTDIAAATLAEAPRLAQRQRAVRLELPQAQEGDDPLGAAARGERDQHPLELREVARDDREQRVGLPRHPRRRRDLRQLGDRRLEAPLERLLVAAERDRHVDAESEAGGGLVDVGVDPLDDAGLLQAPDAVERRGGREARQAGELHVGPVRVALELIEEEDVGFVKSLCHKTKEYFVWQANRWFDRPRVPPWTHEPLRPRRADGRRPDVRADRPALQAGPRLARSDLARRRALRARRALARARRAVHAALGRDAARGGMGRGR